MSKHLNSLFKLAQVLDTKYATDDMSNKPFRPSEMSVKDKYLEFYIKFLVEDIGRFAKLMMARNKTTGEYLVEKEFSDFDRNREAILAAATEYISSTNFTAAKNLNPERLVNFLKDNMQGYIRYITTLKRD